ncbi:MAG TPA: SDR family oxidoreductase [Myxococcales bacterium]|nr:SDR family oxidoreductase [Myxococcales bacterium]
MTTLVTGANGLCGSRIVARLAEAGEKIIAVARGPRRFEVSDQIEFVDQDLLQPEKLQALILERRPAGVINAGAMTDVDASEKSPVEAFTINATAVEAAANACRLIGARFTHLSTDYVFDGEKGDYSEDDAPNPRGTYARSKRAGEEAALLLAQDRAVCRVAVIFTGRKGGKRTFALGVVENFNAGKPVKAFSDQIVSPTLADNAAEMVIGVHQSGEQGIFHCTGASRVTRVEFCQQLARKLGADESLIERVKLAELKLPAPRPLRCGLRVEKVQKLLGNDVPLPLGAALDRFLAELTV